MKNEKLQEATILALQGKLIEAYSKYRLHDDSIVNGREDCDVYIDCTITGTDEGTVLCIIPCKWNENTNKFEISEDDINFINPSNGDEAYPNDIDYTELINKIPAEIISKLNNLPDPDIAAKKYQTQQDQQLQTELQELIKILNELGVDYSNFKQEDLINIRKNIEQGKRLGFSNNILKALANPKIHSDDYFIKALNNCILIGVPESDIIKGLSKAATVEYSKQDDIFNILSCNLLKQKYGLTYQEPDNVLTSYYIKMISKGVPVEFLQYLESKTEGDWYGLAEFLWNYIKGYISYDVMKYFCENVADFTDYSDIIQNLYFNENIKVTKENINLFTQLVNKYPKLSKSYKNEHYEDVYCVARLFKDICYGYPKDLCILKIEYPEFYDNIGRYYNKGLSISTLKSVIENLKTNERISDIHGAFKRACNKLLKQ